MGIVCGDSDAIAPNEAASAASVERIKEATMKKINLTRTPEQTNHPARRRRGMTAAILAAVIVVLSTVALAAVHHLNLHRVTEDETVRYMTEEGQELTYDTAGTIVTAQAAADSRDVCFQALYLPVDSDADGLYWGNYAAHLSSSAAESGRSEEELLLASGMTADEAANWYTTVWYDGTDGFFRIDCYSGAQLTGTDLILDGASETVKESAIGSFEATYVTVDTSGTANNVGTKQHIFLCDSSVNCLIDVFGTIGFDELEQIAEGLVLRETGLEAVDTFGNNFSVIGGGVG